MALELGIGSAWISSNPPPPPPPPPRQRLHIEGTRVMLGTTEFVGRGCVTGHGELYRTGDAAFLAAHGANLARRGNRWWGTYGIGFQVDSELDPAPGHVNEDYFNEIVATPVDESYDAGQRVLLFMDSNCGQGLEDGDVCKLDGVNYANFFTDSDLARAKRAKYIEAACYIVQQKKGRIDMIEPLVEPGAVASQKALWAFQEEFMSAILAVDPDMLFVIGASPNYQPNQIQDAYNPDWLRSIFRKHVILTGNFLTGIASNPTLRVSRVKYVTDARAQWKCPVFIQQVGTTLTDDPDNAHLDAMLGLLDNAVGGPIGYSVWEEFSTFPNSYGFWSLSNPNDPLSSRNTDAARLAVLQSHFTA